jgi:ankyrin repeat protein
MDDKTGRTPLHWAVCHARIRGENSSATDNGAFALAATQPLAGSLKKKKKKSKASKTKATFGGDLEDNSSSKREEEQLNLVRRLVTPNSARIRDRQGQLALHLAVQNQASWNVVACLLEAHPRSGVLPCSPRPPQSSSVEDNFQESDMDESDRDHYAVGEGDDTEGKVDSSSAASSLPYRLRPVHLACHHGCELSVVYALLRGDPGALCVAEEN